MQSVIPFEEAYERVIGLAADDVDVESVYRNLGFDPAFGDDASKLAVALVIMHSGRIQANTIPPDVDYSIKAACRNMISNGQVRQVSPEASAETMDKMRHLI